MNQIDRTPSNAGNSSNFASRRMGAAGGPMHPSSASSENPASQPIRDPKNEPAGTPGTGQRLPRQHVLTDGDIAAIHAGLLRGNNAIVQRRDLGELHRRMVEMFNSLRDEVVAVPTGDASRQSEQIAARLEQVAKSVDSIDGAIRIELAPMIQSVIGEALRERSSEVKTKSRRSLWLAIGLIGGIGIGAMSADNLTAVGNLAAQEIGAVYSKAVGE